MPKNSKYSPLGHHLKAHRDQTFIAMTFADIEQLLGFALPASKRYPAWWSNSPSNNPMTKVWLDAGFETEQVDIPGEKLVFRNAAKVQREMTREFNEITREMGFDVLAMANGMAEEPRAFRGGDGAPLPRHPLIGALKGTFTIDPSWDLTKPALDPEELAEWEASLDRKADMIEQGMKRNRRK